SRRNAFLLGTTGRGDVDVETAGVHDVSHGIVYLLADDYDVSSPPAVSMMRWSAVPAAAVLADPARSATTTAHHHGGKQRTREEGARRDLERRGQVPRPRRGQGVRVDLWCEVSEGGRQDQRRRRAAAGVLRLPGRALDSSENYKSDRIYLRHRAEPEQDHQGPGLPRRRNRHGVQADRGGPVTLAGGQRAPSRGAR